MLIELRSIFMAYGRKKEKEILKGLDFKADRGELLAVMGKSGCGKSTLLAILGGLTRPLAGEYYYDSRLLDVQNKKTMGIFRKGNISFILQDFALLPERTAMQNVELALRTRGMAARDRKKLAMQYLEELGIGEKAQSYPGQMSGGEKQRVAIARALVSRPGVILADEPTGALDEGNSKIIMEILKKIAREGTTVVLVTHDPDVAKCCDRVVCISDGKLLEGQGGF